MNAKLIMLSVWFSFSFLGICIGKENQKLDRKNSPIIKSESFMAACVRPTKQYDLSVNNVRNRLLTGGDLFSEKAYFHPKPFLGILPVSSIYKAGI